MTARQKASERIESALQILPDALRPRVRQHWQDFLQAASQAACGDRFFKFADEKPVFLGDLCRVWAVSDFVAQQCCRRPAAFLSLLADAGGESDLARQYKEQELAARLAHALVGVSDADSLGVALRLFRGREMLRIAWRDIAGMAPLEETLRDLSGLADACVQQSLALLQGWLEKKLGVPCNGDGESQSMVVLGMGKLGASELNFSSDIDLIFAFSETGETRGPQPRNIRNETFFSQLGKQLIRALGDTTAEGFVFRVDMRLRPFGDSGALVPSFAAVESYYLSHGRDWERYALIKARLVVGDAGVGQRLFELLRPFVYRRYLDYGAFGALREMKQKLVTEAKRRGLSDNVKLGVGGIREVEFIGQAFQLIRGGREPALQMRPIQAVLSYLADKGYLPDYVEQQLQAAYVFLRNTEHRLQEFADRQTHQLPDDDLGRLRLAFAMGFSCWDDFLPVLRSHMMRVHSHFEQVFVAPQVEQPTSPEAEESGLGLLWRFGLDGESNNEALTLLAELGFTDPEAALHQLHTLRKGRRYRALPVGGQARFDALLPLLLGVVATYPRAHDVLARVLELVEAIAQRSAYLALLLENPMALAQLVRLCAASSWISRQLARHPLLLDELLDPRSLYQPPSRQELEQDLQRRLSQAPEGDQEQAMETLRHFKQAAVLRVAAADVVEAVPLMQVSDHLTHIAEVLLMAVLEMAWAHLVERHGRPRCARSEVTSGSGFAIVAYGKLGGIELGYGSDLDLVFVHGSDDQTAMTDGPRPIADAVFFIRLGQRIIHLLSAHTAAGVLYDVDMRLRPSGNSGLLVVSLAGLRDYQQNTAWTWEHQALIRARVVAGDRCIGDGFEQIRREVICRQRAPAQLRAEVVDMRERMRASLSRELPRGSSAETGQEKPTPFDLKQGRGGIAEFMVQYGALSWAHEHRALVGFTDNIRLLDAFAQQGLMSPEDAALLSEAYQTFRACIHRLALQEQPAVLAGDDYTPSFADKRQAVRNLWNRYMMGAESPA
ncbi:MAG: bifunctional [glutamate--ammonia ligase]-adenylyl-L-tyrosine phosphorylase/[glutamate--ammonia-ligase] adenylyltransferase [Gammaproteobacteria bacterium]|nr:bifunctional [glutamate--ammonia ligase]-adenylyl-L-tyrosine phosphorylase/[glutamate--ammonia-ligase] adenylyltransferase [Gammaproteobacteria bacterium]